MKFCLSIRDLEYLFEESFIMKTWVDMEKIIQKSVQFLNFQPESNQTKALANYHTA
ncbi:hypothetical protein CAEBREN_20278 [Caenorhabditis brenneri]|uniref:Uncharacterized protein n=1 Tax=Caenorhabditis brenneri TaxID=135651 RepID=G0NDY8_CAEBE|nr:hypothetical protein CAEBREN_20278 [Caenorhabditis brenneri]